MRENFSSYQLLRDSKKKPPTEFLVFPYGPIETTKGLFQFSQELCEELLNERAEHAADVNIDYDHLALQPGQPGAGKAAGWCRLEGRPDGLWAVDVKWTPEAAKMLEAGEYRYISPAFNADRKTGEIFELINIAITNIPATKNIRELVAASLVADGAPEDAGQAETLAQKNTQEENTVPKKMTLGDYISKHCKAKGLSLKKLAELLPTSIEKMRALADGDEATPEEMKALAKAFGHKDAEALTAALSSESGEGIGDEETPTPAPRKAKVKTADGSVDVPGETEGGTIPAGGAAGINPSSRTSRQGEDDAMNILAQLTGETDPARQRGKAAAMRVTLSQAAEDRKAVLALQAKDEANERKLLLERGKAEGKLTPALVALSATWDLDFFSAFLDAAPVVLSREQVERPDPTRQTQVVALTEGDRLVAALANDSADDIVAWKAKDGPSKEPGCRPGQNTVSRSKASYYTPDEAQLVPLRGLAHRQ